MAATAAYSPYVGVTLTSIDADWTWTTDVTEDVHGDGIRVHSIMFYPGAASDKVAILEKDANGTHIFPLVEALGTQYPIIHYLGGDKVKPFIDFSASVLSAGATVVIKFATNFSSRR